ncbi:transposase, partial [Burkholderia multivorans]
CQRRSNTDPWRRGKTDPLGDDGGFWPPRC